MDDAKLRNSLIDLHLASFGWAMVCCRGNRELAEEVLQSVYVNALSGGARFDNRSSFRTWLFAVIRNTARHYARANWWSRVLQLDSESLATLVCTTDRVPLAGEGDEEVAAVRAALRQLPERQREIAHLVFYEGLTIAVSAEVMNVSVGTARRHYARAKNKLRMLLEDLDFVNRIDERTTR